MFLQVWILFLFMNMPASACMYAHMYVGVHCGHKDGWCQSPGARVTGDCESPDMGPGN